MRPLAGSAAAFHAPFVANVSRSCNVRRREDIGAVVVALISNAASHSTAVLVPMKNKLDLASGVVLGSNGVARRGTVAVRQLPSHAFDLFLRRWKWAVTISILSVKVRLEGWEIAPMAGVMLVGLYTILASALYCF